ncbi:HEAT repeat-containing protein 6 [Anopheles ziemanni]|uniref:HEAT repeat-containing protein 6 n=1 Tax=Anopheles coustani TaxID=139045 RepID=UPI00265A62A7|nr:HEAT repeat-containing protein 6 [Anopheles coustani]XP_058173559.1 HEAT repeat-containing protein 6 [Anopheles ziemanni]
MMELEKEFLQLSTKFMFLNCGTQLADYRNEINTLLNELNGLNYRAARISDVRAPVRLVESFVNIPPQEDTLVVKACFLIKSLVSRQKILFPEAVVQGVLEWLRKCLERRFYQVASEVLTTMPLLFRQCKNLAQFYDFFISNNGILINILADPDYRRVERRQPSTTCLDHCNTSELYAAALLSIESMLVCSEMTPETLEPYLPTVGNAVLDLIFKIRSESFLEPTFYGLVASAMNCFRIVVELNATGDWTNAQLGRLIGVGKAFMMYGIPDVVKLLPQRIPVSQQGIPEPQHIPMSKGGRVAKKRKTRTHPRGKKGSTGASRTSGGSGQDKQLLPNGQSNRLPYTESSIVLEWVSPAKPSSGCNLTSDSDYSETEATSSREQIERHRVAKLRQSALVLIGTLAQHVEKRVMFGYWHALFPDETRSTGTVSLLNCVLRDPSSKCRIAAIQATSFLLHKSKPFLIQAESSKKPQVSFTPFSVTLGNMIIEMYSMLTQALSTESDLTVLTQLLKGLTVFIQATPFHRLHAGIATRFVRIVRPLVVHRDSTIKVAALMVMGFLISVPNMTEEIASLVGIRRLEQAPTGKEARSKPIIKALNLQVDHDEEEEEEVFDEPENETAETPEDTPTPNVDESYVYDTPPSGSGMSWLLQVALESLGVNGVASSVMTVRMECLQVLCVMTGHYSLLSEYLLLVAQALVNAFGDPAAEIKLYAGRVLDLLGHAINSSLLLKDTIDVDEINGALNFWLTIVPIVTSQIQDVDLIPSVRSVCCDALGNIGVHVFEKLPRDRQLALISLLTGCTFDEDSAVASAAARALSVYILFPSLRDDVCYVENTVESILRLMKDPNLTARIKTSWSLGNVTDSLVLNLHHHAPAESDPSVEHRLKIGDDLLRCILQSAMVSASDNDKVRSNAVRTIGNVLHLLRTQHLEQPAWGSLWQEAIERLVQNVSNASGVTVKVKWNACYALGSMLKNEASYSCPAATDKARWQRCVFPALCDAVIHSPNFKVRINAAHALSVVSKRAHYGATFFHTNWVALLQALEQSDNLVDYLEYKRRDTLQEQLCLSLVHFLRLATREDIAPMAAALLPLYDAVRANWTRVVNRILPEKSVALMESYHLLVKQREGRSVGVDSVPESAWNLLVKCFECTDHAIVE